MGTIEMLQHLAQLEEAMPRLRARIAALEADNAHLRAKAEERRKVIEGVEWSRRNWVGEDTCPICWEMHRLKHDRNCPLAAALREE